MARLSFAAQKIAADVLRARLFDRALSAVVRPPADFAERVDRSAGESGCWPWRGSINAQGYGMVRVREDGRSVAAGAHRVAYYLATGYWGGGRYGAVIRHLCHNRACCNPLHLLVGSRADNQWDEHMRKAGVDLVALRLTMRTRGPFLPVAGIAQ